MCNLAPWAEANYLGDCTGSINDINVRGHGFRQTIDRARELRMRNVSWKTR